MKKTFIFLLLFLFISKKAITQCVSNELIVQILEKRSLDNWLLLQKNEISCRTLSEDMNIFCLKFDTLSYPTDALFSFLAKQNWVQNIQRNYKVTPRNTPNDSSFPKQWDIIKIETHKLWDITQSGITALGDTIVVGVIEPGGFDFKHEDLINNIWKNKNEIPNNVLDDDQNGYKDDFYGLNVKTQNDKHSIDAHGTSVAGIIGAKGNNVKGVSGVNWNVKMMLVSNAGFVSEIIEGYDYFYKMRKLYNETNGKKGAFIVATNASWGFSGGKLQDFTVFCSVYDKLGKEGILNVASTDNIKKDVDKISDIPSNCPSDYLIVVNNATREDTLWKTSAFGKNSVDLAAPGEGSFTLNLNNDYGIFGGCSAAAPHVAGGIALLYSAPFPDWIKSVKQNPATSILQLKSTILNGVDKINSLENKVKSGGRLNLFKSYTLLGEKYQLIDKLSISKVFPNPTNKNLFLEFSTNNFEPLDLYIYNIAGQLVFGEKINVSILQNNILPIDVSNYERGVYFIKMYKKADKSSDLIKFVKI